MPGSWSDKKGIKSALMYHINKSFRCYDLSVCLSPPCDWWVTDTYGTQRDLSSPAGWIEVAVAAMDTLCVCLHGSGGGEWQSVLSYGSRPHRNHNNNNNQLYLHIQLKRGNNNIIIMKIEDTPEHFILIRAVELVRRLGFKWHVRIRLFLNF